MVVAVLVVILMTQSSDPYAAAKDATACAAVKVDDEINAKVIKVDINNKKIALSIKAYEENLDLSQIEQEQVDMEVFKEE